MPLQGAKKQPLSSLIPEELQRFLLPISGLPDIPGCPVPAAPVILKLISYVTRCLPFLQVANVLYLISGKCFSPELLNVRADTTNRQFVILMKIFLYFQQMAQNVAFVI